MGAGNGRGGRGQIIFKLTLGVHSLSRCQDLHWRNVRAQGLSHTSRELSVLMAALLDNSYQEYLSKHLEIHQVALKGTHLGSDWRPSSWLLVWSWGIYPAIFSWHFFPDVVGWRRVSGDSCEATLISRAGFRNCGARFECPATVWVFGGGGSFSCSGSSVDPPLPEWCRRPGVSERQTHPHTCCPEVPPKTRTTTGWVQKIKKAPKVRGPIPGNWPKASPVNKPGFSLMSPYRLIIGSESFI